MPISTVAFQNGAPVRLRDVAKVIDGSENVRIGAWMNRTPAIIVDVRRQPGANVIATVDAIKAALPDLEASLPDGRPHHPADRPHRRHPRLGPRRPDRAGVRRGCW